MVRTGSSGSTNARVPGVTQLENQQRFRVLTEPLKPNTTSVLGCGSQAPLHFVPGTSEYGGPLSSSVPGRALCAPDAPTGAEPAGDRPTPPSGQSSCPPLRTERHCAHRAQDLLLFPKDCPEYKQQTGLPSRRTAL